MGLSRAPKEAALDSLPEPRSKEPRKRARSALIKGRNCRQKGGFGHPRKRALWEACQPPERAVSGKYQLFPAAS